jgi:DNA-binding transcriptional ArsR family regulator
MVNETKLDAVFFALSDPTRRRIVERLARKPLTVGEIASEFPISQPAISKHVRVLESSGLIQREVVGRTHVLNLSPEAMESASAWIERQRRYWNAVLDRLDSLLVKTPERKKK